MKCDQVRELLLAHLDRELPPGEVDEHLAGCADCRAERDALAETAGMLRRAFTAPPRRRRWFAAAAAALLAAVLLLPMLGRSPQEFATHCLISQPVRSDNRR